MSRRSPRPAAALAFISAILSACGAEAPSPTADTSPPEDNNGAVAPEPVGDPRDLSGVWWNENTAIADLQVVGAPPQLTAAGEARFQETSEFKAQLDAAATDVANVRNCVPAGVPRVWAQPFPLEIAQRPELTVLMYEHMHSYRVVFMDEPLPDPAEVVSLQRNGHSVGRWENDTLVIESTAFSESIVLDEQGLPSSGEQMRTIERLQKSDDGTSLEVTITIEDPAYYVQPWTVRTSLTRQPEDAKLMEYTCGYGVFETRYVTLP